MKILMYQTIICLLLNILGFAEEKGPWVWEGKWNTTTGKVLNGPLTVKTTYNDKTKTWKGTFSGSWSYQGNYDKFSYAANWTWTNKLKNEVQGLTSFDGNTYRWKGIQGEKFFAKFEDGHYYSGSFDLKLRRP